MSTRDQKTEKQVQFANAHMKGSRKEGQPLYVFDDKLHQFDSRVNQYVGFDNATYANLLYQQVDDLLGETARFYTGLVRELNLRAPRLPRVADAPQFLVWNDRFFERVPYHIPLANGVFLASRFIDGQKRHFMKPNHRVFTKAVRPFAYEPEATCPTWIAALDAWLPEDTTRLLQEWFGYVQVFDHRYEKFAFWIGPSRTGKSTAKNVQERLLGKDNVSNVGLERFGTQFGLEESVGRLVNISPDVGTLSRVAEGNIKALVSGDRISFDRKHEKAISVEPTARLQFIANEWPKLKDRSEAIFDRLLVIAFENTIPEEQRDRRLKHKLFSELPGIFNWSMEGLRRLRQQDAFTVPQRMLEEIEELRLAVNPARRFIEECTVEDGSHSEPAHRVYSFYAMWAEARGVAKRDVLDDARFGKELRKVFPRLQRRRLGAREERRYEYQGIRLLESETKQTIRFAMKEFRLS